MKRLLTVLAIICCFLACKKAPDEVAVTSVSLSQPTAEMVIGETISLSATVLPSNATDKSVTWASSNRSVAAVVDGKVTALAEGSSTITASSGGKSASCSITVKKKTVDVTSVELNKTELALVEGESVTLIATVKPDDATDKTVTWTTSDATIATVDNGKVVAVKEGTATITAKAGEKTAICSVVVAKKVIPVESIELNKTTLALIKGASETLVATVKPDDATSEVAWSSSNEGVATVEQDGKVTAVGGGEATITAQAGDKKATCSVKVTVPVESISLDKTALELWEKESVTLIATVLPDDATDKAVTWSTSDANIATVENGKVTAVKEGEAVITAKAGDQSAICTVSVKHDASSDAIVFADVNVKEKLVAAFDTNGDGELSYGEAAAVTSGDDLRTAFGNTRTFKSFDEFKYFTEITSIPVAMFQNWTLLASITVPKGLISIGKSAFENCSNLESILLPEGITLIDEKVFQGCARLISIIIPAGVTSIKNGAFYGCTNLSSVTIPKSVTYIGSLAFSDCNSISEVFLDDLSTIKLFSYVGSSPMCSTYNSVHLYISGTEITEVSITDDWPLIPDNAFSHCAYIKSVTISEGISSIGKHAFNGCSGLTSITIPQGVASIGAYAFYICSGLTSITIPKGVSSIGGSAFQGCEGLVSVDILEGITSIGSYAFMSCTSLNSITVRNTAVPTGEYQMFKQTNNCPIYVPTESVAAYKSAMYWSSYADRIQAIQ